MGGHITPESGIRTRLSGVSGSAWRGILLLLLALSVCVGYFYFFTDFLRSKEEIPGQAGVFPTEVKKPLPARPGQPVASSSDKTAQVSTVSPDSVPKPPVAPAEVKKTTPQGEETKKGNKKETAASATEKKPQKVAQIPPKPATGTAASSSPVTAKPVTTTAKPSPAVDRQTSRPSADKALTSSESDRKKTATPKPSSMPAKAEGVKNVKGESANTAQAKKPISSGSKVAVKPAIKPPDSTQSKQKPVAAKGAGSMSAKAGPAQEPPALKQEGDSYTLVVGTYVMKPMMKNDKSRLEKAGFKTSVTSGKKKSEPMNRLLVSQLDNYALAKQELDRVKKAGPGAFIIQEEGKYSVYAGSYYLYDRAVEERDRLQKQGINPTIKKTRVSVATYSLTSGNFPTREAAVDEAARLKKLGFKPYPIAVKKAKKQ